MTNQVDHGIPPFEILIKRTADPKVLPFVARKVLSMVTDENTSIQELSHTIEKDQSIASKILKIANSPYYGLVHEVTSLRQAILVLGFNSIKDLVLTITTRSQYRKFGITEQMMWDHSVGAAIASRLICETAAPELNEVAFLGGLMHDFGKVVMNNEVPEAYKEVMMRTYNEGLESVDAEGDVFGYDHTVVGSRVVASWDFPQVFVDIMAGHHLRGVALEEFVDPKGARAVAAVNLADNICKRLGIGHRIAHEALDLNGLASTAFLGLAQDELDSLVTAICEKYKQESAAFY